MHKAARWLAILDTMEEQALVRPRTLADDLGGASLRTYQRDLVELRDLDRVTVGDDGWWTLEERLNGGPDHS